MEGLGWDNERFVSWLVGELRRRQWNAAELSRRLEMPSGTVSRWLSGERRPSPHSCDLLADVLGADVDRVLTLAGHRPSEESSPPDDAKTRIIELVKRVRMTPSQEEGLEAMLRAWLEVENRGAPRMGGAPNGT